MESLPDALSGLSLAANSENTSANIAMNIDTAATMAASASLTPVKRRTTTPPATADVQVTTPWEPHVCGVCLSPLPPSKSKVLETQCKHVFHERCLMQAKRIKPECPNCRCELTPNTVAQETELLGYAIDSSPPPPPRQAPSQRARPSTGRGSVPPPPVAMGSVGRENIIRAANRVRNALRSVVAS